MNSPSVQSGACHVTGADKLPAEVGGADAVCAAIKRAVAKQAPGRGYSIEVRILSPSSLSAIVKTEDGRSLPEQRMAVSDSALRGSSVDRFAQAIAALLSDAPQ